ncbi:PREDICTED: repetin-like, partial [Pterocles gutturalis]|uniref:repetin-like n=1 Tax=Pterocles gutturalis TaxID=240206 RepID=UPI0005291B6A
MSRFLDSISTIISIFHQHAKEDGDSSNLSRRKMKEFIQREFADAIANPHDPETIEKILQFLEWDGDGKIDFSEFLLLAFRVAKACYWYLPKGLSLLQRTKLTSGKSLREPEVKSRGSRRQLQEEEQPTCESNHPSGEPELQRDTRVNERETPEETGSHHQRRNTQSRNDTKRSSEPGEPIPQTYEERSREPCDQRNSQRRRHPPEPDRRGDVKLRAHQPQRQAVERQNDEGPQPEQVADVRSHSQTCEPQPRPNWWSSRQPHEPSLIACDQKNHKPQEADRGSYDQPRKPELIREERSRYHLRELEQKAPEDINHKPRGTECMNTKYLHQSYIQEPPELDLTYCETSEPEKGIPEERIHDERDLEHPEREREIHQAQDCEERGDVKRKEPQQ